MSGPMRRCSARRRRPGFSAALIVLGADGADVAGNRDAEYGAAIRRVLGCDVSTLSGSRPVRDPHPHAGPVRALLRPPASEESIEDTLEFIRIDAFAAIPDDELQSAAGDRSAEIDRLVGWRI